MFRIKHSIVVRTIEFTDFLNRFLQGDICKSLLEKEVS